MNVLFLTTVLPFNRRNGGEIATMAFLDALDKAGCSTMIVGYNRQHDTINCERDFISVGTRPIETARAGLHTFGWMLTALSRGLPYSSAKFHSSHYATAVRRLLAEGNYSAVVLEHSQLGWLLDEIPDTIPLYFSTQNVEHELYSQHAASARNLLMQAVFRRESRQMRAIEERLAARANQVWALTDYDGSYFSRHGRCRVFSIPSSFLPNNGEEMEEKKFDIGLIGSWTWKANAAGLHWFFESVYPRLSRSVQIHVAGRGAEWVTGTNPNVHYHGFVDDAHLFMKRCRVVAIPSTAGGGIQVKTLDAIASCSQVVATPVAMRGISDYPSTVVVDGDPVRFAEKICSMLSSKYIHSEVARSWSLRRRERFEAQVHEAIHS